MISKDLFIDLKKKKISEKRSRYEKAQMLVIWDRNVWVSVGQNAILTTMFSFFYASTAIHLYVSLKQRSPRVRTTPTLRAIISYSRTMRNKGPNHYNTSQLLHIRMRKKIFYRFSLKAFNKKKKKTKFIPLKTSHIYKGCHF